MLHDVTVDAHGLTDVGRTRENNEDQFLIGTLRKSIAVTETSLSTRQREQLDESTQTLLLLVADGVAGQRGGERASAVALESVVCYMSDFKQSACPQEDRPNRDILGELESSVRRTHIAVRSAAASSPDHRGMATTLTVVYVLWPRAYVVHVGDTRCYLLRGSELTQLTKDQTIAQLLIDQGMLSAEEARGSKWSHVLSSAVGADLKPLTSSIELEPGDTLLLCTDGLTKHVSTDKIMEHLIETSSAEGTCHRLVTAALEAGGSDNITVVVSRFADRAA